jgi:glutathione reductase (NADPH)
LEERDTGRILGAHYLGQHAEEIANILGLAVRHKLTRADLLAHPWAYPSFGYALRYMLS